MNLKSEVSNVFENNSYTDLFKIRWLYLYICKLFSYDTRFMYADEDLKEKIYNKKIDIENVENFEIVCYSICRILIDALSLYSYECEIIKEHSNEFSHVYVLVKYKDHVLKLDPTKRHDLTRVKINSNTLDFVLLNDDLNFNDELKEVDEIITDNYKDIDKTVFYDNKTIEKLVETVEKGARERKITEGEFFYEKVEYLFSLINTRTDLKRYDDMDYYFSYLIKKFKLNDEKEKVIIGGKVVEKNIFRIKPAIFFNKDDKNMKDIINIAMIKYKNMPTMFYLLKKEGERFVSREIFKDEAIEILKQYKNPMCQYMFECAAFDLSNETKGKIIL